MTAPDVRQFVATETAGEVLDQLTHALLRGDDLAILLGAPGVGKTMVSKVLAERLSSRLRPIVLSSANFPTRRALYQSVLFALGRDFVGLSEQEARLLVLESSHEQLARRGNLVLIIDEAQLLTDRLLDELRSLVSHIEEGRPLVQVLLLGQSTLESRLLDPRFQELQRRIGCLQHLLPMGPQAAIDYIRQRIESVGGTLEDIFSDDALQLITELAAGNPRCINLLCDRALHLADSRRLPQVTVEHVHKALEELRQFPLAWNETASIDTSPTTSPSEPEMDTPRETFEIDRLSDSSEILSATPVAENGHALPATDHDESCDPDATIEGAWASYEIGVECPDPLQTHNCLKGGDTTLSAEIEEILINDPYAQSEEKLRSWLASESQAVREIESARTSVVAPAPSHEAAATEQQTLLPAEPLLRILPASEDIDMVPETGEAACSVQAEPDAEASVEDTWVWTEEKICDAWPEQELLDSIQALRAMVGVREQETEATSEEPTRQHSVRHDRTPSQVTELLESGLIGEFDVVDPEPEQVEPAVETPQVEEASGSAELRLRSAASDVESPVLDMADAEFPPPALELRQEESERDDLTVDELVDRLTQPPTPCPNNLGGDLSGRSRFSDLFTRLRRKRRRLTEGAGPSEF